MVFAPTRTTGRAVFKSPGGVKAKALPTYYYYATERVDTLLWSNFSGWTNTPSSYLNRCYTASGKISGRLVDGVTGAFIGYLRTAYSCTPRMNVLDEAYFLGIFDGLDSSPDACSNNLVVDSVSVAQQIMKCTKGGDVKYTDLNTLFRYRLLLASSGRVDLTATGYHSAVSGTYVIHPSGFAIKREGNNFYKHVIKVTVDSDIDAWYKGKYRDDYVWYDRPIPFYKNWCQMQPDRNTKTLLESSFFYYSYINPVTGESDFNYTAEHNSCYYKNTRVTIPVYYDYH